MEKEVEDSWEKGNQVSQLFKVIEKEKKKPVGYEDGETMIFKKVGVLKKFWSDFLLVQFASG